MSHSFGAEAERPDSRIFASYPMPAKIDLLNERPRRESQVERQLEDRIGQQISPSAVPKITITEQQNFTTNSTTTAAAASTNNSTATNNNSINNNNFKLHQQQEPQQNWSSVVSDHSLGERPTSRSEAKETRIIINHHSTPIVVSNHYNLQEYGQPQPQQQRQQVQQQQQQQQQQQLNNQHKATTMTTTTTSTTQQQLQQRQPSLNAALNKTISNNAALLATELAEKEAKLMREISALHQRPYSPFQTPAKIDLTIESRMAQQQYQNAPQPSSRPNSRASNKSNTGLDLLEKEAKLLRVIEEIESKPYNPQTMIVEREQWFEYPENRPQERHLTESKRRVRDFCSMPSNMCQEIHVHEENLLPRQNQAVSATPGRIHTRSPMPEIDNKSPLPFAFDNFTTKGVRGNIASVGAVEPDRPRAPIFPIVKRSASPNLARG